jgi:hypothetical protein
VLVLASAQAKRVLVNSHVDGHSYFVGNDCDSTDTVAVDLPAAALKVRAVRPLVGDELRDGEQGVVAEVTAFRTTAGGAQAEWTAKGSGAVCTNPGDFGSGWSTPEMLFRASYTTRERVTSKTFYISRAGRPQRSPRGASEAGLELIEQLRQPCGDSTDNTLDSDERQHAAANRDRERRIAELERRLARLKARNRSASRRSSAGRCHCGY